MPLSGELSPLFGLVRDSGHAYVAQRIRAQCVTHGHVQCLLPARDHPNLEESLSTVM